MFGHTFKAILKKLIKNSVIIAVCGIITKIIGAIYRVPLTGMIGAEGIGIYQMVFPVYCILLTLSSTGIPNGIAKLTANGEKKILKKSLIVFGLIGLAGSMAMYFLGGYLSGVQGNMGAEAAYKCLSPSVFLVSLISCFRGYYQGKLNMLPTGISQLIEQAVKLAVGLTFCGLWGKTAAEKACLATLAVTISELAALIFLLLLKREKRDESLPEESLGNLIKTIFPIMLCSFMLPLTKTVDSFLVINLLKEGYETATAKFGLYSGVVESIVALPIAVCYSLAVSGLPLIAKGERGNDKKVLLYTLAMSAVFAVGLVFTANAAIEILYPNLNEEYKILSKNMLKISSLTVILLSMVQAFTSVLIGLNKLYAPSVSLFLGLAVKTILTVILVPIEEIGIYGMVISDIFCYFVATAVNLLYYIIYNKKRKKGNEAYSCGNGRRRRRYVRQRS